MKSLKFATAAAAILVLTGAAQAALVSRGGGMVYDTVQNITWLADINFAGTGGPTGAGGTTGGVMTWEAANDWASKLEFGGFDDWRLPSTNSTPSSNCDDSLVPARLGFNRQYFGFYCSGSEMGHLHYIDFGVAEQSIRSSQNYDALRLFENMQSNFYWTGTEYAPDVFSIFSNSGEFLYEEGYSAWYFDTSRGYQYFGAKSQELYALAVRNGDVVATVPEPHTLALALLALGATVLARSRRAA